MPTIAVPTPTLTVLHCPVIDCRHVIHARRAAAAVDSLSDHIAFAHGGVLVRPA